MVAMNSHLDAHQGPPVPAPGLMNQGIGNRITELVGVAWKNEFGRKEFLVAHVQFPIFKLSLKFATPARSRSLKPLPI